MSTTDDALDSRVMLSVQRALVGCITPEMRYISVEWSRHRISLHIYVDGAMRDNAYEDFDAEAMTQIFADFSFPDQKPPQVGCTFHRCDAPQKPDSEGRLVYGRKET